MVRDLSTEAASHFIAPHALWADPDGSLTVVEWTPRGRVVRLEPDPA